MGLKTFMNPDILSPVSFVQKFCEWVNNNLTNFKTEKRFNFIDLFKKNLEYKKKIQHFLYDHLIILILTYQSFMADKK